MFAQGVKAHGAFYKLIKYEYFWFYKECKLGCALFKTLISQSSSKGLKLLAFKNTKDMTQFTQNQCFRRPIVQWYFSKNGFQIIVIKKTLHLNISIGRQSNNNIALNRAEQKHFNNTPNILRPKRFLSLYSTVNNTNLFSKENIFRLLKGCFCVNSKLKKMCEWSQLYRNTTNKSVNNSFKSCFFIFFHV